MRVWTYVTSLPTRVGERKARRASLAKQYEAHVTNGTSVLGDVQKIMKRHPEFSQTIANQAVKANKRP